MTNAELMAASWARIADALPSAHVADGSYMTVGAVQRACTCGQTWFGTSEDTFAARLAHIEASKAATSESEQGQ